MDKTTETFAAYVDGLSYSDLTSQAIHAVKRSVIDSIGCAFGAFDAEPSIAARRFAAQVTAKRPATVFGTRIKTSPEIAGFVNGGMVRYLDFSDDYFGSKPGSSGPHPSDNIGTMLAISESIGANGQTLVLGIVLAYECCGQMVECTALRPLGWDYPIEHAIGSSLGAGKILGLTRDQLGNALAIAVVPNICLGQNRWGELSNWKGMAGPNGSRQGLFAARLAKEGITGPPEPFDGKAGFKKQLNQEFELGTFGGKGVPFKIEGTYFKYIPVRYTIQLPVWTALGLRKKVKPDDIQSAKMFVDKFSLSGGSYSEDARAPKTRETADHGGYFLIAAALVDGEVTVKTMSPEKLRDPAILAMAKRLEGAEDPTYTAAFPREFNARIEATLKSGQVVKVALTNPKGHPANPLSDQDIEEKFLKQVDPWLEKANSRQLLALLWNLENLDDLGKIFGPMETKNASPRCE